MYRKSTSYQLLPGLTLGFHGTSQAIAEKVLGGKCHLDPSSNDYDWLGHGIYFWEYSPQRAYEFAKEKVARGELEDDIAVVGAVIASGRCLNLLESSALAEMKQAYELLELLQDPPKNLGGADLYKRYLDCAVIEALHYARDLEPKQPPYDTVRGAFWEGEELYPNAGFKQKNHVQLCVRNVDCIKGYFRPIA